MIWKVSELIGLSQVSHLELIVDVFHYGFNQNKTLEMHFGSRIRTCNFALLLIHRRGNDRPINSKNDNGGRRHLNVMIVETKLFYQPNITALAANS
jgi:hypothetical protein